MRSGTQFQKLEITLLTVKHAKKLVFSHSFWQETCFVLLQEDQNETHLLFSQELFIEKIKYKLQKDNIKLHLQKKTNKNNNTNRKNRQNMQN